MSQANPYDHLTRLVFRAVCPIACIVAGTTLTQSWRMVRALAPAPDLSPTLTRPFVLSADTAELQPLRSDAPEWAVFRGSAGVPTAIGRPIAWRLAGTFFTYENPGTNASRKAIIASLSTGSQIIVGEGEMAETLRVVKIERDSVCLRNADGTEIELSLGFTAPVSHSGGAGAPALSNDVAAGTMAVTDAENKFGGRRVGETSWVFTRQSLMSYYQQLRDNPERMVKIFDTMKPLYDDRRMITGYVVGIEGEADFFAATGLQQGDVVRSVNERAMTSKRLAEAFISAFLKNQASAFVIDVERNGTKQKMIYQVRDDSTPSTGSVPTP